MGCCTVKKTAQLNPIVSFDTPGSPAGHLHRQASSPRVKRHSYVKKRCSARIQDFELLGVIGSGGFGTVYRALDKSTGLKRAIKKIDKTKMNLLQIEHEIEVLKYLDHPNIVQIFEFIEEPEHYYIVMELCDGPNLFHKISGMDNFTEKVAANYLEQILAATSHCHERGIIHRDIKPENILFESNDSDALIKVIDFGLASRLDARKLDIAGTPYFIAPEVLEKNYDQQCDMWSIGVVLFIMLSGKVPFSAPTTSKLFRKIQTGTFEFKKPEWEGISSQAKRLIQMLLKPKPADRLTAVQALQHPWIRRHVTRQLSGKPEHLRTLTRLKTFSSKQKLRQAMLGYIASHLSQEDEVQTLQQLFIELDVNRDGKLSKAELRQGYSKLKIRANIEAIMDMCDVDNDGFIDHTEFITSAINWEQQLTAENLLAAFKEVCNTDNGKISVEDLRQFIGKDEQITAEYIDEMIREADINGDGQVDLEEFFHVMTNNTD